MTGRICLKISHVCYLNMLKSSYLCIKNKVSTNIHFSPQPLPQPFLLICFVLWTAFFYSESAYVSFK